MPENQILIENKATNTAENISFSLKLLEQSGVSFQSVILVTKPYMERRAWATACKLFPKIKFTVSSPQIFFDKYPNAENSLHDVIETMVGDLHRIMVYPTKGFMIPQEVTEKVNKAYNSLVSAGFNSQLV